MPKVRTSIAIWMKAATLDLDGVKTDRATRGQSEKSPPPRQNGRKERDYFHHGSPPNRRSPSALGGWWLLTLARRETSDEADESGSVSGLKGNWHGIWTRETGCLSRRHRARRPGVSVLRGVDRAKQCERPTHSCVASDSLARIQITVSG